MAAFRKTFIGLACLGFAAHMHALRFEDDDGDGDSSIHTFGFQQAPTTQEVDKDTAKCQVLYEECKSTCDDAAYATLSDGTNQDALDAFDSHPLSSVKASVQKRLQDLLGEDMKRMTDKSEVPLLAARGKMKGVELFLQMCGDPPFEGEDAVLFMDYGGFMKDGVYSMIFDWQSGVRELDNNTRGELYKQVYARFLALFETSNKTYGNENTSVKLALEQRAEKVLDFNDKLAANMLTDEEYDSRFEGNANGHWAVKDFDKKKKLSAKQLGLTDTDYEKFKTEPSAKRDLAERLHINDTMLTKVLSSMNVLETFTRSDRPGRGILFAPKFYQVILDSDIDMLNDYIKVRVMEDTAPFLDCTLQNLFYHLVDFTIDTRRDGFCESLPGRLIASSIEKVYARKFNYDVAQHGELQNVHNAIRTNLKGRIQKRQWLATYGNGNNTHWDNFLVKGEKVGGKITPDREAAMSSDCVQAGEDGCIAVENAQEYANVKADMIKYDFVLDGGPAALNEDSDDEGSVVKQVGKQAWEVVLPSITAKASTEMEGIGTRKWEYGFGDPSVELQQGPVYFASKNKFVVPSGYALPIYDMAKESVPVIYGTIGYTAGHEFFHAFDKHGREMDYRGKKGAEDSWLPTKAAAIMNAFTACYVRQARQYVYNISGYPDTDPRGSLAEELNEVVAEGQALGVNSVKENVADAHGVMVAMQALEAHDRARVKGVKFQNLTLTPHQLYFMTLARGECVVQTPHDFISGQLKDPHAPGRNRANLLVLNNPSFFFSFGCDVPAMDTYKYSCNASEGDPQVGAWLKSQKMCDGGEESIDDLVGSSYTMAELMEKVENRPYEDLEDMKAKVMEMNALGVVDCDDEDTNRSSTVCLKVVPWLLQGLDPTVLQKKDLTAACTDMYTFSCDNFGKEDPVKRPDGIEYWAETKVLQNKVMYDIADAMGQNQKPYPHNLGDSADPNDNMKFTLKSWATMRCPKIY